jgi:hypothetical protein
MNKKESSGYENKKKFMQGKAADFFVFLKVSVAQTPKPYRLLPAPAGIGTFKT